MRKIFLSILMAIMLVLPATTIFASQNISVIVDGKQVVYDSQPVIQNGSTLVPLRQTFEALNADVDWNANTKVVSAFKDDTEINLQIGNKTACKNGTVINLSVSPVIINGRTYVPLRFVAESFGAEVNWNSSTKVVTINSSFDSSVYGTYEMVYATSSESAVSATIANLESVLGYRLNNTFRDGVVTFKVNKSYIAPILADISMEKNIFAKTARDNNLVNSIDVNSTYNTIVIDYTDSATDSQIEMILTEYIGLSMLYQCFTGVPADEFYIDITLLVNGEVMTKIRADKEIYSQS